ncbi:MAG: RNA polymerase sigma factor [Thermomicrobiales bacterium]
MLQSAITDAALVDRTEATARFVSLYRELFSPLYGYVRFRVGDAQVAEDLTAEVFERALARLVTVREPERVRAWLFVIARNVITDYRRRHRCTADLADAETLESLWIESPEHSVIQREEWRRVVGYLADLDEREREAIGLKFAAGLTNREIGRTLGYSHANIAQIIHRAIVKLRRRFDAEEKES